MRKHNDSERKSAGLPAAAIQSHARKGVENNCVFSLSFGPFLSLFFAIKEKEKGMKKRFIKDNFLNKLHTISFPYGLAPIPAFPQGKECRTELHL